MLDNIIMELIAIIGTLISTLIWLGKKYVNMVDEKIKKSEVKLQNEIVHRITFIIEKETEVIKVQNNGFNEIKENLNFLVKNNSDLNDDFRKVLSEFKSIRSTSDDNKKDIELLYQIIKSHNKQLQFLYKRGNS